MYAKWRHQYHIAFFPEHGLASALILCHFCNEETSLLLLLAYKTLLACKTLLVYKEDNHSQLISIIITTVSHCPYLTDPISVSHGPYLTNPISVSHGPYLTDPISVSHGPYLTDPILSLIHI